MCFNYKMRQKIFLLVILIISIWLNIKFWVQLQASAYAQTKVLYCPQQKCDQEIINQLQNANQYAYVAMYTLTKIDLVNALIAAKMRGIDVEAVIDFNQSLIAQEKPQISKLKKYGIPIHSILRNQGLMHIKMLITEKAYLSGSYNWTNSATNYNDEVLEVGAVKIIHDQYLNIFQKLLQKYPPL